MLRGSDQDLGRSFPPDAGGHSPGFPTALASLARCSAVYMAPKHIDDTREVLEFDCEVRALSPAVPDNYWRIRWVEAGRRRDTTARSRDEAIAKATDLVERLGRGTPTALARDTGAELVQPPPGGAGPLLRPVRAAGHRPHRVPQAHPGRLRPGGASRPDCLGGVSCHPPRDRPGQRRATGEIPPPGSGPASGRPLAPGGGHPASRAGRPRHYRGRDPHCGRRGGPGPEQPPD